MTDINILVSEITLLFKKEFDNPFSVMVLNSCIGYRASLLKQEYDKNGRYPLGSEDSLVLPLIRVSPIECCCSENVDCVVARTSDKVPSPVRGNFKPEPFLYVGSTSQSTAFVYAQPNEVELIIKGNRFTGNLPIYSFFNDYIYTFQFGDRRLGVRDVFSNPLELMKLKNCDGLPCITTINIEDDMKKTIKMMVIEEFRGAGQLEQQKEVDINE